MMNAKLANEITEIAKSFSTKNGRRNDLVHVDNMLGAMRYVRDANRLSSVISHNDLVLDLGCGAGQVSYLLGKNGFKVIASEIFDETPLYINEFNRNNDNKIKYIKSDILDDNDQSLREYKFDAIILYGVLEHVPNFGEFLLRTKDLLAEGGKLFIMQFPNKYSWVEKINDIKGTTSHELRLSPSELNFMLRWHGFRINGFAYEQILPMNLRGLPSLYVKLFQKSHRMLSLLDLILRNIPLINIFSTSFKFDCAKARTKS